MFGISVKNACMIPPHLCKYNKTSVLKNTNEKHNMCPY